MILRETLVIGVLLLMSLLFGIGWYAMSKHPDKYRQPRIWLYGIASFFLLSVVLLFLLIGRFDLESIILIIAFGLFGSIGMAATAWITILQRDWAIKWSKSLHRKDKPPRPDR